MKLRNKKTGEIAEPFGITCINGRTFVQFDDGKGTFKFEAVVVCPNCHTPISKGDIYCRQCNKLLVRQIFGGEE